MDAILIDWDIAQKEVGVSLPSAKGGNSPSYISYRDQSNLTIVSIWQLTTAPSIHLSIEMSKIVSNFT